MAAHHLEIARQIAEDGHSVDERFKAVDRVADLEQELEKVRAERDDLQRQLANANQRIDTTNELVRAVEEQRSLEARRAKAGLAQRAKWWLFGMAQES